VQLRANGNRAVVWEPHGLRAATHEGPIWASHAGAFARKASDDVRPARDEASISGIFP
jgi:hypothetical protein